jgi:hypothetical protein
VLDVGITKLLQVSLDSLLRVCDMQAIISKNLDLKKVQLKIENLNKQETLNFKALFRLEELVIFGSEFLILTFEENLSLGLLHLVNLKLDN